jgi:phage terminase large subunit-like protein
MDIVVADRKERRGGHNRKSVAEHLEDGTYREDRHGPLVQPSELASRPVARPRSRCGRPGKWARSPADEYAIREGCWFDERRAAYVVEWFKTHLQLSDSEWSGQPFDLQQWQRDEIVYPLFGWMRQDEKGRTVRRFNMTYIEIPKKNGKSTLASGIGLYMLCGEGNKGNEVYSAATDKDQASIVHGEAIRMVESSSKLSAFLKVNYTTRHIYNRDVHVTYKAIASRPAGSEGLKGNCCIIDELHAWHGDELWNALRYMGVNWTERLIFCITTAGDDPESVCYRQYETAKAIERGEILNDRMLVCIHEAAQDEDIEDEAVQRRANPSLGHTILRSDLVQDIAEAKKSARTMAVLKRYRFNVWQASTNPWLDPQVWLDAKETVTLDELEGLPCVAAIDLARKWDMTALALLFRRETHRILVPFFWLPEETAVKRSHLASYRDWANAGELKLTEGATADYGPIGDDIIELCRRFKPRAIAFDDQYAEEITQRISAETGIERFAFPQTFLGFAAPSAAFERMLTCRELRHNGNRLLAWQAGHVQVKEDNNQNIRPVKERRASHKSVDGIVAAVMALGMELAEDTTTNTLGIHVLSDKPAENSVAVHAAEWDGDDDDEW